MMPDLDYMDRLHGGYWRHDVIDFRYLHNMYFPPPELYAALQRELPVLAGNYPSTQRTVAGLLAEWKDADYFSPDNLVIGNGSSELIRLLCGLIGKATVPVPTFNEYLQLDKEKLDIFLLQEKDRFRLNLPEVMGAIQSSNSDFVIINNPNNPVGNLVSRPDIEALLESRVNVIVDEAFIDWSGEEHSCEDLVPDFDNLIIIKSLTKVAGIGGLRLGYLLTNNRDIKEKLRKALPIWNINAVAERFIELLVAFRDDFEASIERGLHDRHHLMTGLKGISYLEPFESHANFVFCRTQKSAFEIARFLYERHGMLIKYSMNQGPFESDGYIRIGVRKKIDNDMLLTSLKALEKPIISSSRVSG